MQRRFSMGLCSGVLGAMLLVAGCGSSEETATRTPDPDPALTSDGALTRAPEIEREQPAVDETASHYDYAEDPGPDAMGGTPTHPALDPNALTADDDEGEGEVAMSGDATSGKDAEVPPLLDFEMARIDGTPQKMSAYQGQVVMYVNVASKCGRTPQYKGLQTLHERYREKGLRIVAFPANNFGNQEPGTNEQIAEFCEAQFGVTFDMMGKISVRGDDAAVLYQRLTREPYNTIAPGPVRWNFEKFILDREGRLIARFASGVDPLSQSVVDAIEKALGGSS